MSLFIPMGHLCKRPCCVGEMLRLELAHPPLRCSSPSYGQNICVYIYIYTHFRSEIWKLRTPPAPSRIFFGVVFGTCFADVSEIVSGLISNLFWNLLGKMFERCSVVFRMFVSLVFFIYYLRKWTVSNLENTSSKARGASTIFSRKSWNRYMFSSLRGKNKIYLQNPYKQHKPRKQGRKLKTHQAVSAGNLDIFLFALLRPEPAKNQKK